MKRELDPSWPVWIGGRVTALADARVPLGDAGVLVGRAAFTTLPVRERRPLLVAEHRARLARDAAVLGIAFDAAAFDGALAAFAPHVPAEAGALRVHVSGGPPSPWLALLPRRVPADDARGIVVAAWPPVALSPLGAHKLVGRAALELAQERAAEDGADDALVSDASGRFVGATAASLVVRCSGRLLAPGPESGALDGVGRSALLVALGAEPHAADRWRPEARPVTLDELAGAEEVLLVGSVRGVRPVRSLLASDGARPLPGASGALAQAARARWEALLAAELAAERDGRRTRGPR